MSEEWNKSTYNPYVSEGVTFFLHGGRGNEATTMIAMIVYVAVTTFFTFTIGAAAGTAG